MQIYSVVVFFMAKKTMAEVIEAQRIRDETTRRNLVLSMQEGAIIRGGLKQGEADELEKKRKQVGLPSLGEGQGGPLR